LKKRLSSKVINGLIWLNTAKTQRTQSQAAKIFANFAFFAVRFSLIIRNIRNTEYQ
jgi:hypothetical protein